MMSRSVTITAKSLEQAVVQAAGALGVTQDEIQYEVVKEETQKGLFSFFKNPVVEIKAWIKDNGAGRAARSGGQGEERSGGRPRRERERRPAPRREDEEHDEDGAMAAKSEPLPPEKVEALTEELRDFCAGICSRIAGEPVAVTATTDDGRLVLNVDSEAVAQQIAKNSKLAEAMEHILRKKPRHLRQELPFRIFVDVSGMRKKREDELVAMAHDLSAKVHENKRPIVLNYKSSYDRKIIHMALDKDERVYTKSIGSGPNRKLMILPSKGSPVGEDSPQHIDAE
jgi:spoIIIJ-associated protein